MAPRAPDGVVTKPASPQITSVLVTIGPSKPGRPVRGIFRPFRAGWFLILSGVSPWAICQSSVPFSRPMALMVP